MDAWVRHRKHLSVAHLQAADFFCRESGRIEEQYMALSEPELLSDSDDRIFQHRSFVIGSIFSAVAFLEAAVNEFFADAASNETHIRNNFNALNISRLSTLWSLDIPRTARYSILQKYDIALALLDNPALEHAGGVYQEVLILVRLRNALMHFEPETTRIRLGDGFHHPNRFDKFLKGKFQLNPLVHWKITHYPDLYLSHSCASWGVKSSVRFVDDFFFRIGLEPPYEYREVEEVRVKWRGSYY